MTNPENAAPVVVIYVAGGLVQAVASDLGDGAEVLVVDEDGREFAEDRPDVSFPWAISLGALRDEHPDVYGAAVRGAEPGGPLRRCARRLRATRRPSRRVAADGP